MDVFFLEIQKFDDSATIVEKHQNNLIIWIIFHCPYSFDFFFTELVPVMFVWVAILILCNIDICRVVFVTDIVFQSICIQLIEQYLNLFQCWIILAAIINYKLQICQLNFLKYLVVEIDASSVGCIVSQCHLVKLFTN